MVFRHLPMLPNTLLWILELRTLRFSAQNANRLSCHLPYWTWNSPYFGEGRSTAPLLTGKTQQRCSSCPGPVTGSAWSLFSSFTTWECSGARVALTWLSPLGPMVHTECAYGRFKLSGGASMATLPTVGCCWGTWPHTYCAPGDCRVLRLFSHSWGSLLYSGALEINTDGSWWKSTRRKRTRSTSEKY